MPDQQMTHKRARAEEEDMGMFDASLADVKLRRLNESVNDPNYETKRFNVTRRLGSGAYGVVVEAKSSDGLDVAIKIVRNRQLLLGPDEYVDYEIIREINLMQILTDHVNAPNIVQMKDWFSHGVDKFFIVMELGKTSIREVIQGQWHRNVFTPFPLEVTRSRTIQILRGLHFMHFMGVVHRDLKPDNVIVFGEGDSEVLKIADFGMSRPMLPSQTDVPAGEFESVAFRAEGKKYTLGLTVKNPHYTDGVTTLWYRSPEMLLMHKNYDECVDIWALGTMITELEMGTVFCLETDETRLLTNIIRLCGTPTDASWPEGAKSIKRYPFPIFSGVPTGCIMRRSDGKVQPDWFVKLCGDMLVLNPARRIRALLALQTAQGA